MAKNKIIGKLLWWNPRDMFGIIQSSLGERYYIDISGIRHSAYKPKNNDIVTFEKNENIKDCLCATNLEKISTKQKLKVHEYHHLLIEG